MFQFFLSKIKPAHQLGLLALLAALVWLSVFSLPDNKLKIVFCDVGQGDAILIQKGFNQILIDGGPNNKVLNCLANNMPFFDRTLEIVALTHPQADHLTGLNFVIERYNLKYFLGGPEGNSSASYATLMSKIKLLVSNKKTKIINPYAGQKIKIAGIELQTLWPDKDWVTESINNKQLTINNFYHFGGAVLGASTTKDLNDFSLVFLLKYGDFFGLFTGDADAGIQDQILLNNQNLGPISILKVPHHGAKNALRDDFLEIIKPQEAIISVGKNSYGHPSEELLRRLEEKRIKIRRTDLEGEIKIFSDGKNWYNAN